MSAEILVNILVRRYTLVKQALEFYANDETWNEVRLMDSVLSKRDRDDRGVAGKHARVALEYLKSQESNKEAVDEEKLIEELTKFAAW